MLSTFLSNDWTVGLGQSMFEYDLYPIFFHYCWQNFIYMKASLLLSSSNDVSANTVDDESFFEFSPKVEFASPLYVHITLAIDTNSKASCFA